MDIFGARLRSERERMGHTQDAWGELVGVKKNAQIHYEAGKRWPDGEYLIRAADAGADVLYILTGRREGVAGSGLSEQQAISQMDQIETALQAAGAALPSGNAAHRSLLQSIALDNTLPDRTRARADLLLRLGFHDSAAEQRHIDRETRIQAIHRRARIFVDDAARAAGFTPSLAIQSGLQRLISTAPDAPDDVIKWVIADLIAAIKAEGGR